MCLWPVLCVFQGNMNENLLKAMIIYVNNHKIRKKKEKKKHHQLAYFLFSLVNKQLIECSWGMFTTSHVLFDKKINSKMCIIGSDAHFYACLDGDSSNMARLVGDSFVDMNSPKIYFRKISHWIASIMRCQSIYTCIIYDRTNIVPKAPQRSAAAAQSAALRRSQGQSYQASSDGCRHDIWPPWTRATYMNLLANTDNSFLSWG